ncbi:AraC family transcriptional regulator, partial [Salmonella enterica subsp. enterica]|uniref:helix-turn-helix domain-containing protein n=1 Tax=Salmonella enterica TaxID=28901 RepID=UPI0022B6BB67|nr:AraC family transcriptional regulator [Salmonella enterica]
ENAATNSARSVLKSSYEKDCIREARTYLNQHIDQTPTLSELAKIAGINEFKLKNGFKELFDTTVFGYLSDIRLLEAKEQLRSGKAIKVISDNL